MWWTKPYQVERACTCAPHARSAECAQDGWHVVDSFDTAEEAIEDARHFTAQNGVKYRAIVRATGRVL